MTPGYVSKLAVPIVNDEEVLSRISIYADTSAVGVHNEHSDDIWSTCIYLFTGVYVMNAFAEICHAC